MNFGDSVDVTINLGTMENDSDCDKSSASELGRIVELQNNDQELQVNGKCF
jgi:hypothetical protein